MSINGYFVTFIAAIIIANTILLAMDSYPPNAIMNKRVELANLVCSVVFFFEMMIKLIGLGFKGYLMDPMNQFNCVIVLTSIVDISISQASNYQLGGSAVTAIRAIRLLRVFKLAKTWKKFRFLLKAVIKTAKEIVTFSILLLLFIFTYTLLGLELFADKAKFNSAGDVDFDNGTSPMYNFDSFFNAFTTVFIVLTNDSWQSMYYAHYRAVNSTAATLFFISLVIIGQKILLNLFLAILLENFDESHLEEK